MIRSKFVGIAVGVLSAQTVGSVAFSSEGIIAGSVVNRVVIDPHDSNLLYAVIPSLGIFKSIDAGESWFAVNNGLPDYNVRTATVDPNDCATLYVGLNTDIYKTVDGGAHWFPTGPLSINEVHVIAIDPQDSDQIYAGGNGIFPYVKSTNGGSDWSPSREFLGHVMAIAIDHNDSNTVYAGTYSGVYGGRVHKSVDGGKHWTLVVQGLANGPVHALVIDRENSDIIYAALDVALGHGGIYKSTNAAGQWEQSLTDTNLAAYCLAMDPLDANTLYAGTYSPFQRGKIFKTIDGGKSWYEANEGIGTRTTLSLAIDPKDGDIIYAGTSQGIFKSIDGGKSWFDISQ